MVKMVLSLLLQQYVIFYPKLGDAKKDAAEAVGNMKHFETRFVKSRLREKESPGENCGFVLSVI